MAFGFNSLMVEHDNEHSRPNSVGLGFQNPGSCSR